MSSGDKPILTFNNFNSFTDFCIFQYLADFHIKVVLLGQNNFE